MKAAPPISLRRFVDERRLAHLDFRVVAGEGGLDSRTIRNPRIQKPGLALAGFLPYVKPHRVQILGQSEYDYLKTLFPLDVTERLIKVVEAHVPGIVSTKGNRPPDDVLQRCNELGVPCITTSAATSVVIETVSAFLEEELAPRKQVHGVLVDVFSLGTLIVGDPGIGKSECALELVYRGHRLVADDLVVIRRTHNHGLQGSAHELLQNYLELRGVGIIDVRNHFGMTATSRSVSVSLVIELLKLSKDSKEKEQEWRERMMEKPSAWASTENLLDVEVPKYTMAVAPGRDVAIMVETAVRKCLLAQRGIEDERRFLDAINRIAEETPANARDRKSDA